MSQDNEMDLEDLENYIMNDKLKFCLCGNPASVLSLLHDFIKLSENHSKETPPAFEGKSWESYCQRHKDEMKQLIIDNHMGVQWLIYYILDEKNIFLHGGNVSGGWLRNEKFFSLLSQWKEKHINATG